MTQSPDVPHPREASRAAALKRYGLLDASVDGELNDVARVAARLCATPIALVTVLDGQRQLFRAKVGFEADESPLDIGFCPAVVALGRPLVIPDTLADPAHAANPATAAGIRFYAGVPLFTRAGEAFGTICVLDRVARTLDDDLLAMLEALARQVMTHLELRSALHRERAAEARGRQILDSATDHAIIATNLHGLVTRWNEGARRIFGWGEAEMLGQPADRIFTPEDLAAGRVETEMRQALRTPRGNDERWHRRASGERFWASGEMTALGGEDGVTVGFVKVLRDRTEQRLADEARREAEARLKAAHDVAQLGTFHWDVASGAIEMDGRSRAIFDLPAEGPVHQDDVFARIDPAVLGPMMDDVRDAMRRGARAEVGYPVIRADGTRREISSIGDPVMGDDGQPVALFGVFADVTERKRAADALLTANETLEQRVAERTRELTRTQARADAYFDLSPDYLMLVRVKPDGTVLFEDVNPAAEAVFGRGREALAGMPIRAVLSPGSAGDVERHTRACVDTGRTQTYTATRDFTAGLPTVVDSVVALIARGEGDSLVLFSGRDMSERNRIAEQLRQAQKMEAVGQLTGGLAHDFNNLLAGISGSLELMGVRVGQGRFAELGRYIDAAQGAARRAAALTHRLLAFSRRQTLEPKPTDVNRLVAGMEDMIRRTVGPAVAIDVVGAPGLWATLVDPPQLENALLNLCINARDAMPDGGRLTVETRNTRLDDGASGASLGGAGGALTEGAGGASGVPAGPYVSLSVRDTGTGMPPDVIAKAFDPFFTTKPLGAGTGLGLSMIYGFARQSGGQVRIHSTVGAGTLVTIDLPRHEGETTADGEPTATRAAPRAEQGAEQGDTVLVVDDEPTVRMLVREVLQDLGHTAIEASDSAAGLGVLRSDARIDLLVTDVGLPGGMNGRQMAEAGKAGRADLKVLFITGYAETAVLNHGQLGPGMHVMTKPFTVDALAERISALLS